MMRRCWALALLLALLCFAAEGQRRVTPVKGVNQGLTGKNENKQASDTLNRANLMQTLDENGNTIFVDTISGTEVADSANLFPTGSIPKMQQPLIYAAALGVDIWDPVMRLFGQHYGITEFSAELNLHNRYIPVIEGGIGAADYQPGDNNYRFKVPLTPYFRIGANYNFLYNSNPDYMVFAGLRFGWSHFKYDVDNITMTSDYWGESTQFSLPTLTSNVTYMQVLFGLRVKIVGPISMGWCIRIKAKLHETEQPYGQPWYLPGYGSRNGLLTGSFSVTYTLPLSKSRKNATTPPTDGMKKP